MNDADGCPRARAIAPMAAAARVVRDLSDEERRRVVEAIKRAICPCLELCDRYVITQKEG